MSAPASALVWHRFDPGPEAVVVLENGATELEVDDDEEGVEAALVVEGAGPAVVDDVADAALWPDELHAPSVMISPRPNRPHFVRLIVYASCSTLDVYLVVQEVRVAPHQLHTDAEHYPL